MTELEIRKETISLMRAGYGIHPDRYIVLVTDERFKSGELNDALRSVAAQYAEDDFIITFKSEHESAYEDDNLYELTELSDSHFELLKNSAKMIYDGTENITVEQFFSETKADLDREGFNRSGTTLLAVDDDDTTRRIRSDGRESDGE